MRQDLYQVLGLGRHASPEEIKKAYRELAKRHHPDRTQNNPADTEIFKAVAIAFATLSNPAKRADYDRQLRMAEQQRATRRRRVNHVNRAASPEVTRWETPFADIVGEFFQGRGGGPLDREDRRVEIILTPREAFSGVTVPLDIPWKYQCPLCNGSGLAPFSICAECRGSGFAYGEKRMHLQIPAGVRSGTTQRLCFALNPLTIVVQVKIR
ncbi:MAG: DnaJ domain-containing protein [Nitrospinae bacterium]|nr:DnaJ domain-containing protein [Nitrospinota bacterium]